MVVVSQPAPHPQGLLGADLLIHFIADDAEFDGVSVNEDANSRCQARSVIGEPYVLPLTDGDRLFRFQPQAVVQPAVDQIHLQLAVLEVKAPAGIGLGVILWQHILGFRNDRAVRVDRSDPRGDTEAVEVAEVGHLAQFSEVPGFEGLLSGFWQVMALWIGEREIAPVDPCSGLASDVALPV